MGVDSERGELEISISRRQAYLAGAAAVVLVVAAAFTVAPVDTGDVTGMATAIADGIGTDTDPASPGETASPREQDDADAGTGDARATGADPDWDIGRTGSAHEHAIFAVAINGRQIDFSRDVFQLRDRKVHFESVNGTPNGRIIHKHATGVTIGYALSTLNMSITRDCLAAGTHRFCEPAGNLSVFVDGSMIENARDHVIRDGEVIEILYRSSDR